MFSASDLKQIFRNLIHNPIGYLVLVFNKTIFMKLKYKQGADYNAKLYWEDRFKNYRLNIKGPGYEGATKKDNEMRYARVLKAFQNLWRGHISETSKPKTLEIGVGTGIITGAIRELGVTEYVGFDITDILFDDLRNKFPNFCFYQSDVTKNQIKGKYDTIVIIDVLQHIVTHEKLNKAFSHLCMCLNDNGLIFLAPLSNRTYKRQFYEYSWSLEDIEPLSDYKKLGEVEWMKGISKLVVLRKTYKA